MFPRVVKSTQGLSRPALYLNIRSVHVEQKLEELGFTLAPGAPKANYVSAMRSGPLLYLSGHIPYANGCSGDLIVGKVGDTMDEEAAYKAARMCGIGLLGTIKHEIGDLDKVKSFVKVGGMVNCTPDFTAHPSVLNGVSDLLVELYGPEKGQHTRVAAGFSSLPLGVPVEVDMIVELERPKRAPLGRMPGPAHTSHGSSRVEQKDGDWTCPQCNFHNFARNYECKQCRLPNTGDFSPVSRGPPAGGAPSGNFKEGDWNCPGCGFHNFARNHYCKDCSVPRPFPDA